MNAHLGGEKVKTTGCAPPPAVALEHPGGVVLHLMQRTGRMCGMGVWGARGEAGVVLRWAQTHSVGAHKGGRTHTNALLTTTAGDTHSNLSTNFLPHLQLDESSLNGPEHDTASFATNYIKSAPQESPTFSLLFAAAPALLSPRSSPRPRSSSSWYCPTSHREPCSRSGCSWVACSCCPPPWPAPGLGGSRGRCSTAGPGGGRTTAGGSATAAPAGREGEPGRESSTVSGWQRVFSCGRGPLCACCRKGWALQPGSGAAATCCRENRWACLPSTRCPHLRRG